MKTALASLESVSPYSQSKYYETPHLAKELHKDYETRTWKDRCHINDKGFIFIPPMAIKNALSEAARFISMQIPGKGKSTYTKHFEAGILVTEGIILDIKKDQVQGEWFFVPADGQRGGSKRVLKCFPVIPHWQGDVTFYVLDDLLTEEVFLYHLEQAGNFIGLGRFRPRNNGFYGRFKVNEIAWEAVTKT